MLLDHVPGVVARIDLDGVFQEVYGATEEIYGRSPQELVGTQCLALAHPADRAEAERRMREIGPQQGDDQMTARVQHTDGRLIWVDSTARSVRDPDTGEEFIVFTATEANARMEVESALSRVEDRYRELVEWLPAVVYEAEPGPQGRFLYIGPQIEEILGYTPEEWMANPDLWRESIHPEEVDAVVELERQQQAESIASDARIAAEYRMVHRDGHTVFVRDIARISEGAEGERFWRGVLSDITAERGAQEALADAHEHHRGMIDSLPACSYRAERRPMGRWHYVSPQIKALLGYSPEEWCADPTLWRASLHTDDRDRIELEEKHRVDLPPGTEVVTEYRLRHRTGRVVAVRDRAMLTIGPEGEPLIEGILTDISAERASQEAADVLRLSCGDCGMSWAADKFEHCPECGSRNVDSVSLNAALRDLALSRQQVEGLLDGIQKHLDALGTNLRTVSGPVRPPVERRAG
jgi:PAS domain S-box-containing protein